MFQESKHQVDAHCDPDLRQDGITAGPHEGLDLQILLDPLEEELHLPTLFVDFGDRPCCEPKVVGQEVILVAGFGIAKPHSAQWDWTVLLSLLSRPLNRLVARQTAGTIDFTSLRCAVPSATLDSGDEEHSLRIQLVEPAVVDVTTITGNDTAARQAQSLGAADVRRFSLCECHEGWQIATMVQAHMKLDGPLGGAELGPWKDFQTEVDDGCIEGVERVLEAKFVLRSDRLTLGKKPIKDLLVKEIGLLLVDPGQIGSGEALATEMIELVALRAHIVDDISQARSPRELGHGQGNELRPAVGGSEFAAGVKSICEGLELMSRDHLEELVKYRVMMGQGSDLLLNQRFAHH